MSNENGFFVAFEATSKCGKTTLSELLNKSLIDLCDCEVLLKRGALSNSEFGRQVKDLGIADFGYSAAFYWADLVFDTMDTIQKAMERGAIVVQDRYDLSVVSYREAYGCKHEQVLLDQNLRRGLLIHPDLTVFLRPNIEDILERIRCGADSTSIDLELLKQPEKIVLMQERLGHHLRRLDRNFITIDTSVTSIPDSLELIMNRIMSEREKK